MERMEQKEKRDKQIGQEESGGKVGDKKVRQFFGRIITPENRNKVLAEYMNTFINVELKRDEFKEVRESSDNEEILKLASFYANFTVRKEQKHYKAYLKNSKTFTYKNIKYPVLTFDHNGQMASDMIKSQIVSNQEEE